MREGVRKFVMWIIFGSSGTLRDEEFPVDLDKHDEIIDRLRVVYEHVRDPDPVSLRVRGRKYPRHHVKKESPP